jgi:hypothetical protein
MATTTFDEFVREAIRRFPEPSPLLTSVCFLVAPEESRLGAADHLRPRGATDTQSPISDRRKRRPTVDAKLIGSLLASVWSPVRIAARRCDQACRAEADRKGRATGRTS